MAGLVLRVRLVSGGRLDVTYEERGVHEEDELIERATTALASDAGALRVKHGDRLVVLFGRGVAAIEVGPRGPVL